MAEYFREVRGKSEFGSLLPAAEGSRTVAPHGPPSDFLREADWLLIWVDCAWISGKFCPPLWLVSNHMSLWEPLPDRKR